MYMCISALHPYYLLPYYYLFYTILFLHLLSTNNKCTQPCYFSLLLKPAAQKMVMENSSMKGYRLALPRLLSCGL
jgi:hypothetical protein